MAETELLAITAKSAEPTQLELQIQSSSGAALGAQPLLIEFKLPTEWVDTRIVAAGRDAHTSQSPPNMASLGGVITMPAGWSVWAYNEPNEFLVALRIFNNLDQQTGATAANLTSLNAGATLTVCVPLQQRTTSAQIMIPYSYQSGGRKGPRVDGSLEVILSGTADWKPQVSLTTDQPNPMMIPFTTKVKISWKIANAVGAVLRGPLSGGLSELTLSSDRNSEFWVEEGAIEVRAVGPVTYMLDAEVKGPSGQPNVQVIRMLSLDISKSENYASMRLLPDRALPHDQVQIQWAVWGVKEATILFGSHYSYQLELTEQDLSRNYQGVGIWPVRVPGDQEREIVSLRIKSDQESLPYINREVLVASWNKVPQPRNFTGQPIALTYAEKNLGLLTSDGFYRAFVGGNDTELKDPNFRKVETAAPKRWLALTAIEKGFVLLRQTENDDLQVMRFGADGKAPGSPIDLPGDLKSLTRLSGTSFQLAAFGKRVYVTAEAATDPIAKSVSGRSRRAVSVSFEPEEVRAEPVIERLTQSQLIVFNGGLYALNRGTGAMFRFDLTAKGELDNPLRAASAVQAGKSMARTGVLLSLGQVLIVLGPAAVTGFDDAEPKTLLGGTRSDMHSLRASNDLREASQDLVYNPQKDQWATCGHGLTIQPGALAAFRGGASKRLWVLQPNGEMHTLQEAGEDLFAPDYVQKFPSKVLPSAMDAKREIKIHNRSGIDLVPVDSVCRAAGLEAFSVTGLANITPLPGDFPDNTQQTFTLQYNQADSAPIKLRFLAKHSGKNCPRYLLELTISGAGLSSITSVFLRLMGDEQGTYSITEIPDTLYTHPNYPNYPLKTVPYAGRLANETLLYLQNSTFHELSHDPAEGPRVALGLRMLKIKYTTPSFYVTFPGAEKIGRLLFEIDFTKPLGIEASFGAQPQQSLVRINRTDENMLEISAATVLKMGSPPFVFEQADGTNGQIGSRSVEDVLVCVIKRKSKREIDMVRIGDGVASPDGKLLYVPLAKPGNPTSVEIWSFDADSLAYGGSSFQTTGGVFSVPNSLATWQDKLYAMFGDTTLYELDNRLGTTNKRNYLDYQYISGLAATAAGDLFLLAEKQRPTIRAMKGYVLEQSQFLLVGRASGQVRVLELDGPGVPMNLGKLAVSPDGNKVAICKPGGLVVVNMFDGKVESINLPSTSWDGDVTFSRDGTWIYCTHAQRGSRGGGPRRIVYGKELTVSRVRASNLTETRTITLPDVGEDFGMARNTRQLFREGEKSKEDPALSLALSPDGRSLFVSAGKTIYTIDAASFTLLPWSKVVELPCRVFHVKGGMNNTWIVFALGSDYVGDGEKTESFRTHLYALSAPKS